MGIGSGMHYQRLLKLTQTQSILLLGPRGTGKTSLISSYKPSENVFHINLLDWDWEDRLSKRPQDLADIVHSLPHSITHVVIDEVQKIPKLLDVVHALIENTKILFLLTGSSAKKLRMAGVNSLAGRAFLYALYPLTFLELAEDFQLHDVLHYGSLPKIFHLNSQDRADFLRSYAQVYLREEIWNEHVVRKLQPFRRFLEVAAQMSGKILNMNSIAIDVGIDGKTVASYFQILEDTLLGFFLEPFRHSFRKRLTLKPKFYFFDIGIVRSLRGELSLDVIPQTSYYGDLFEHYIILEVHRLCRYLQPDYVLSYLQTQANVEVELVISRAREPLILIEIKSGSDISEDRIRKFHSLCSDLGEPFEAMILCQETLSRDSQGVKIRPWRKGIMEILNI